MGMQALDFCGWQRVLVSVYRLVATGYRPCMSDVMRDVGMTYSYLVKLFALLEKKGLIRLNKEDGSREVYVSLTPVGEQVGFWLYKVRLYKVRGVVSEA
jgi:DNA-binding MarR family transcriptional regulator